MNPEKRSYGIAATELQQYSVIRKLQSDNKLYLEVTVRKQINAILQYPSFLRCCPAMPLIFWIFIILSIKRIYIKTVMPETLNYLCLTQLWLKILLTGLITCRSHFLMLPTSSLVQTPSLNFPVIRYNLDITKLKETHSLQLPDFIILLISKKINLTM